MKKLVLIITTTIMSFNMTFAGNGNLIRKEIIKELKLPANLKSQSFIETVNVQFKIDSNGKVSVLRVDTSNMSLKNYVIDHFNKIDLSKLKDNKESIYNISINFKVI